MTTKNAAALREALDPWCGVARRISGRRPGEMRVVASGVDNRAVRAWASSNGIALSERGRIPASVIEQFHAAGH